MQTLDRLRQRWLVGSLVPRTFPSHLTQHRLKEAELGPSLVCPTAYAKGIKDVENRYTLKLQHRISSSGQR